MKTSKVTKTFLIADGNGVEPKIYNDPQWGLFYFHWVEFENGDKGEYKSKAEEQSKFIVDNVRDYSLTPNSPYADKIKPEDSSYQNQEPTPQAPRSSSAQNTIAPTPQQPKPNNDPRQISIEKQCCIKAGAEFHKETNATREDVLKSAQLWYNWVNDIPL